MSPEDTRNILMLAAVEELDEAGIVLPLEERLEASRSAGAPLPAHPSRAQEDRFLATRANLLLDSLRQRLSGTAWIDTQAPAHPTRHPWLVLGLLAGAALVGYLSNELGPERRINILSFPLLGILCWSLLVYLREIVLLLSKGHGSWLEKLFTRRPFPHPGGAPEDPVSRLLGEARLLFERRWAQVSAAAGAARVKCLLHLLALLLAGSAVAGLYVRGFAREYRAVWESTFIEDSAQLRPFLQIVLGPAIALRGETLPSVESLNAIRGALAEGESAARWIHWYALTIALFVLIPRALLALLWGARAAYQVRALPYRETAPRYFARLLASSSGAARRVALVPYAFAPDEALKGKISQRLEDAFGAAVDAHWLPLLAFGEEDRSALPLPGEGSEVIPVFSFAATPEKESHLALFQNLNQQVNPPLRFVLLEASAFDRKLEGLADAGKRRADREAAWRRLFAGVSVDLLIHPETPV